MFVWKELGEVEIVVKAWRGGRLRLLALWDLLWFLALLKVIDLVGMVEEPWWWASRWGLLGCVVR